jgi:hypothetical protein
VFFVVRSLRFLLSNGSVYEPAAGTASSSSSSSPAAGSGGSMKFFSGISIFFATNNASIFTVKSQYSWEIMMAADKSYATNSATNKDFF